MYSIRFISLDGESIGSLSKLFNSCYTICLEMAQESSVAFDIILESAKQKQKPIQTSPRSNNDTLQEQIQSKLQNAEERRKIVELEKKEKLAKNKEREEKVREKAQGMNSSFQVETQNNLETKLEITEQSKQAQLKAKQEKLKEHVSFKQFNKRRRLPIGLNLNNQLICNKLVRIVFLLLFLNKELIEDSKILYIHH
ncbi:DgyrCDS891 [Dimorphilus gyrociliatus]|uniref:Stathmin n=1 Tax=Dimorphilus gyrociliatus TaxID=2664684 RepID=A0A7I8V5N2_9ANNE|nr:DgyrCDS891 [Dimorphilus gyrociliatus]